MREFFEEFSPWISKTKILRNLMARFTFSDEPVRRTVNGALKTKPT